MAKFPIYETSLTPPSQSGQVRHSYSTDSGGAELGRAVQNFGKTVENVAVDFYQMQGQAELAEATAADDDAMQKMLVGFQNDSDEHTYQQRFDDTWSEIKGREIKNGWARREHDLMLTRSRPKQQAVVQQAYDRQVAEKAKWSFVGALAKGVETGSFTTAETLGGNMVATNMMTQDELDLKLDNSRHENAVQVMQTTVSKDPDRWLGTITDVEKMQKAYPHSLPKDFGTITNLAQAARADRELRDSQLWDGIVNDTLAKAWQMSLPEFGAQVQQTNGLTEVQKLQLMKVFANAVQYTQQTGKSPFVVTQNEASLAQSLLDIENGSITSLNDINKRCMENGKQNWSTADMMMVKRVFASKQSQNAPEEFSFSHPISEMAFDSLNKLYMDKGSHIPEEKRADYIARFRLMEQGLRDPNNWGKSDKMYEVIDTVLNPVKAEKARSYLDTIYPAVHFPGAWYPMKPNDPASPPVTVSPVQETAQLPRVKANKMVASHQEGQALPPGTTYGIPSDPYTYKSGVFYSK